MDNSENGSFLGYVDTSSKVSSLFENPMLNYKKPEFSSNATSWIDQIFRPLIPPSQSNDAQAFRFEIGGLDDPWYLNLQSLKIHGTFKILKSTGADLAGTEDISIVNLAPQALFEQYNVTINSQAVSDHGRGGHLRGYLAKHFSTSAAVKKNMRSDYYIPDQNIEPIVVSGASKSVDKGGFKERKAICSASKDIIFAFQPPIDLISTEVLFPAGYTLGLELERASPRFMLLNYDGSASYIVRIMDLYIECRRTIPSQMALRHLPNPRTGVFHIPFRRTTIRFRQIYSGIIYI